MLTYQRLKNMAALVLAACFFAAVYLGHKPKLEILAMHAIIAAERIFGIPDFRYYAIADGIKEILNKSGHGTIRQKKEESRLRFTALILSHIKIRTFPKNKMEGNLFRGNIRELVICASKNGEISCRKSH